jgi:hypothetical protein
LTTACASPHSSPHQHTRQLKRQLIRNHTCSSRSFVLRFSLYGLQNFAHKKNSSRNMQKKEDG